VHDRRVQFGEIERCIDAHRSVLLFFPAFERADKPLDRGDA